MNKKIRLVLTIIIAFILSLSLVFKFFYPIPAFRNFYIFISLFELTMVILLLAFYTRWFAWAGLACVFSLWGGYSLYTTIFGLPCSCMGSELMLPRGLSFALNILLTGASWFVLKGYTLDRQTIRKYMILCPFLFVVGFLSASIIYKVYF
jgi:hypothetical protein